MLDHWSLKISRDLLARWQLIKFKDNKLPLSAAPWCSCRLLSKFIKLNKIEGIILIKWSRTALWLRKWLAKIIVSKLLLLRILLGVALASSKIGYLRPKLIFWILRFSLAPRKSKFQPRKIKIKNMLNLDLDLNKLNINKVKINPKLIFFQLIFGTMLPKADLAPFLLFWIILLWLLKLIQRNVKAQEETTRLLSFKIIIL